MSRHLSFLLTLQRRLIGGGLNIHNMVYMAILLWARFTVRTPRRTLHPE